MKYTSESRDHGKTRRIAIFIAVLLFIVLLLLLFRCGRGTDRFSATMRYFFDRTPDAGITAEETGDDEMMRDLLEKKVSEGMITISMCVSPTFRTGSSEGELGIYNDPSNLYPQIVEIECDGAIIYRSGMIPVGARVVRGKLLQNLDKGSYPCTAFFHSIDENGEIIGTAGAAITVHVLK